MSTTTNTTIEQIGRMNLLSISGGRVRQIDDNTISLPIVCGYSVVIEYRPVPDLYNVRRVLTRGMNSWVKGEITDVYSDQLGEIAYRASCFRDVAFGEHQP